MFWADTLLKGRTEDEWVNDAWTPSGMVHMGGLKGPVIHDTLYRILKQQGGKVKFTYGFDDADPIDGLPPELRESHSQYLGVPINIAPSPDGNGSFGDYFSGKMRRFFKELNIEAEIYLASDYYKRGVYNDAIIFVLDHIKEVRKVYEDMYKNPVSDTWYPLQVICSTCGKLGTTRVTGWDGKKVSFTCEPNLVVWAKGCGAKGEVDPLNGNGKLSWKVEWAAKWWTFGVTIEGAGKDHASAGGSYDIAMKICAEVFKHRTPLKIPYEFFLYNGKKMASSKGIGLNAEQLLEVLPPEVVRFLMIKTRPNQAVEFNPNGTLIIPTLFDEYQKYADAYFNKTDEDMARIFELSQVTDEVVRPPSLRFSVLAQWVQMPNMADAIKEQGLTEWAKYARIWVERFAPDSDKFAIQEEIPEVASQMKSEQKEFLRAVADLLDGAEDPDELQKAIYEKSKEIGISSKDAFGAIYGALLGKNSGPKAGWLILSLESAFVQKRFRSI